MMRNHNPKRSISVVGMNRLLIGLPLLGFATAVLLLSQEPAKPVPPAAGASASADQDVVTLPGVGVKAVQAPVTVLDRDNRVVNGLNALDFTLLDNGKPQKIFEDMASHPISLVVAIQANSGMEHILPQIRKIGSLFDGLVIGEDGEIAVVSFDHKVQVLTNFTSDPDQIHAAFNGKDKLGNYVLKAGSWTSAMNDATMEAINMLKNRPANRKRIIILISESRDQGSGLHVRDVLTAAEFANVVIYPMDVSHLLTSLTSTPTPSRPNNIPPGGINLPARHGDDAGARSGDEQRWKLDARIQRAVHRRQRDFRAQSAGGVLALYRRARVSVLYAETTGTGGRRHRPGTPQSVHPDL